MNFELNTERPHLFAPNIQIVVKIDFYGVPDANCLESAIHSACKTHEILNTFISINSDGTAQYEKINKNQFVKILSDDWIKLASHYSSQRFKIEKGELIKFFIIPKENYFELLIIAHHLAGDGLSLVYLIESIAKTLQGEKLIHNPIKILNVKDLPENTQMSLLNKLYVQNLNKKWLRHKQVFNFSDAIKIHDAYWNKSTAKMLIHQFTKAETNAISLFAKINNVTFNSLLTAIIADEYSKQSEIGIAVSVRGSYRGLSNMVSGISIHHREKNSLSKNIQSIHKSIYARLHSNYKKHLVLRFLDIVDGSFLDSAYIHQYLSPVSKETDMLCKIMRYGQNKRSIGISNLSKLDISSQYDEISIDNFVFIPPLVQYTKRTFGAASLNDKMTLSLHLLKNDNINKEISAFNNIVDKLKSLHL